jgi:RNA polymerase sigma factor for flagellar operon FliA
MSLLQGKAMYSDVDKHAMDEVVERHAPLVKRIAHHLLARMPASVLVEDLIQAGLLGLLEAARNYDASRGASFETYAGIRIRGAMIDDVRRGDWAPRSVHRNSRRVTEAMRAVEGRLGHDASDQQVADQLGVSLADYYAMLKDSAASKLFSFEELTNSEDGAADLQIQSGSETPFEGIQADALRQGLAKAIGSLPERERLVLALYYDEELNLKEIGLVLGVSESRVSQIHSQAALRLRSKLEDWQSSPAAG